MYSICVSAVHLELVDYDVQSIFSVYDVIIRDLGTQPLLLSRTGGRTLVFVSDFCYLNPRRFLRISCHFLFATKATQCRRKSVTSVVIKNH